ncbi:Alpha-N-acetylglucosaminidase (NAGLU) tim-barrel domain [Musa troglodytarum]|uniref:Alpha-N-acetylglucosaminidase (NAGLU) tim-barrel domain n=1 Tax=Musa troglodytarum TaxID=320322 RepID=A0A9E7EET5_9LILI|nr:Alpha-N-acetylglucosaminidase (NAGLU) tim-barrel domain [Musa troglodytarum]
MVVLDLFAEVKPIWITSKQFYGVPYIWKVLCFSKCGCMLHNFAGNIEMYGILDAIALGPIEARTSENSTMVGVGMSMEGIEQNPVVYDLMSEMAFRHKPVDVKIWVDLYATRRYGRSVPALQDAWQILYHTLYNCTDGAYKTIHSECSLQKMVFVNYGG